jgi:hypothetical protein
MPCSDPYLTYLKRFGYNVVRLPRADVRPGQLLTRNGRDLTRLGELADLLAAEGVPAPPVLADQPAANLSGQQTGDLTLGIGLSLLGTIIGALGGSKLGLDATYARARAVVFQFEDVREDRLELLKLDAFLGAADVNPRSAHARELLFADEVYVTTATIKSSRFTVDARDAGQRGLELSIPEIQQAVGGNVRVSGGGATSGRVTYEGALPLVFGFQAVQLDYEGGRYQRFKATRAGDVALEAVQQPPRLPDQESVWLASTAPFVSLGTD